MMKWILRNNVEVQKANFIYKNIILGLQQRNNIDLNERKNV